MKESSWLPGLAGAVLLVIAPAQAVSPTQNERFELREFVSAKFEGARREEPQTARLSVLANHDPVQKNARGGWPMRIADRTWRRGLYCHAVSKIIVRLPGPGEKFTAVAGVDSNEQTAGGRGSVVFSVSVGGKEAFRSPLMREGMAGVAVEVDLRGASEFTLDISDGGDGISCDQADWADAKVTLADGAEVWLGDLPIEGQTRALFNTDPPFSFTYGERPFSELVNTWTVKREQVRLDGQRTRHEVSYTDPQTGLVVRCRGVEYHDFPTVEWTLYFKNTGTSDSPILADIQALDTRFEREGEGDFVLHHHVGSPCTAYDYEPLQTRLGPGAEKRITTSGGRPTNSDLPYFNIGWPGEGVIAVIGWPGQWAATFTRDGRNGLRVRGGQELTRFRLRPGEEVRGPLVVLQFYKGDPVRAQNLWRRWMVAHNLPRPGGKLLGPHLAACSSHQFAEMINANEQNQKFFVDRYVEEKLGLDYWWMDAGWYPNKGGWPNTGTWEVDTSRFPRGLRAISDHARSKGIRTIVWFEPERVTPGTWLYEKHPEWLLGPDGGQKLLNLGNSEARQWLTDHVDRLLTEQGIDLYRQDFNIDPLEYWRKADPPDRQGITEIYHVTGYLAFWDELRRRHPDLLIDSCASGGRRNDLETLRRAVPLLRSDYILEPVGNQNHTYGLASWVPAFGTGLNHLEPYGFRSCMCFYINACYDMRRRDADWAAVRRFLEHWRAVAPCYLGDYYPLTGFSRENDVWMAWQFDRPETGEGVVQTFRRADSIYESARFKLQGLAPDARYELRDLDGHDSAVLTGRDLAETGLLVTLKQQPSAALITYKRLDSPKK